MLQAAGVGVQAEQHPDVEVGELSHEGDVEMVDAGRMVEPDSAELGAGADGAGADTEDEVEVEVEDPNSAGGCGTLSGRRWEGRWTAHDGTAEVKGIGN